MNWFIHQGENIFNLSWLWFGIGAIYLIAYFNTRNAEWEEEAKKCFFIWVCYIALAAIFIIIGQNQ